MVPRLRLAILLCSLAAAAVLGAAFASEWWGGLVPCALCLVERWPFRIAIGLGVLGLVVPRPAARIVGWAMVLVFLAGAAAGVVHVGVEQKLWPSPLPQCQAPNFSGLSIAERLARMPATPSKACEDPTYLVPFVPVSMAAMNLLVCLALALGLGWFLKTSRE